MHETVLAAWLAAVTDLAVQKQDARGNISATLTTLTLLYSRVSATPTRIDLDCGLKTTIEKKPQIDYS